MKTIVVVAIIRWGDSVFATLRGYGEWSAKKSKATSKAAASRSS